MNSFETMVVALLIYGAVLQLIKFLILNRIMSQESGADGDLSKISRMSIKRVITKASLLSYAFIMGLMLILALEDSFSGSAKVFKIEFLIFNFALALAVFIAAIFAAMKSKVFFDILS